MLRHRSEMFDVVCARRWVGVRVRKYTVDAGQSVYHRRRISVVRVPARMPDNLFVKLGVSSQANVYFVNVEGAIVDDWSLAGQMCQI